MNSQHLFIHLLHAHSTSEDGSNSEISAVSWITGSHHVLGIKHLLSELGNSASTILLSASSNQRSEARHEEVETREGDHVDRQLPEVSVELTREPETGGDTRHGEGDQVVEVTIGGSGELQSSKLNDC